VDWKRIERQASKNGGDGLTVPGLTSDLRRFHDAEKRTECIRQKCGTTQRKLNSSSSARSIIITDIKPKTPNA